MRLRSLLYVPAHAERFVARAHERGADAIILDLEDSVPQDAKISARDNLAASVRQVGQAGAAVFVRINAPAELRFDDAAAACRAGVTGLMIPKLSAPEELDQLATLLTSIEREPTPFIGLVEDPGAVLDARSLGAHPRVMGLALGGEDYATAMGAEPTPEVLRLPKQLLHMAAKACGKQSFGLLRSVADYTDLDGIRSAAAEAKAFGFDGATCVHPSAVPLLNAGFSPTETELDWAQRLATAAKAAKSEGRGAFALDGKMVDAPVIARARTILDRA